jgi:hypothetical protein
MNPPSPSIGGRLIHSFKKVWQDLDLLPSSSDGRLLRLVVDRYPQYTMKTRILYLLLPFSLTLFLIASLYLYGNGLSEHFSSETLQTQFNETFPAQFNETFSTDFNETFSEMFTPPTIPPDSVRIYIGIVHPWSPFRLI